MVTLLVVLILLQPLNAAKKPVTAEAAAERARPSVQSFTWSKDGQMASFEEDDAFHIMNCSNGEHHLLINKSRLEALAREVPEPERSGWRNRRVKETSLQWFPSGDALLLSVKGDLFRVEVDGGQLKQLTATSLEEFDPKISPDGRLVSFVRERELWVLDVASGKTNRLTRDATDTRWNGVPDWVYPEELSLGTAHWWSPDGRSIAYLQFDVSGQDRYPHADLLGVRPVAEPQWYPMAGTKNATVRLGVVPARGGRTRWLHIQGDNETLLARVYWLPGSREVAAIRMNRLQNRLELVAERVRGGEPRVILVETDPYWINLGDDYRCLEDRGEFLWTSERDGFRHIYLYGMGGELKAQLTNGDWEVASISGVAGDRIYFVSTEDNATERHLYWVGFGGGKRTKVTKEAGVHSVSMAPEGGAWVDSFSSLTEPPRKTLRDRDGVPITLIETPKPQEYDLQPVELKEVASADGVRMYAQLIRPKGFLEGRKYPAVVEVYGGPGAQRVRNSWQGADLGQLLAARGFVVWRVDNRGSAGRGHAWETKLHRQFGKQELADQLDGVRHLVKMDFVDPERIGIHGWSYGGYMTLTGMLHAPDTFRAGVAGAPVTDWRNYDTIYTERYMGLPAENEEGYRDSSPVQFAERLEGPLMLIHNFEDDNVLFQHTLKMASALQEAGKQFDMMIYPQKTHGVTGDRRAQMMESIVRFFERALKQ